MPENLNHPLVVAVALVCATALVLYLMYLVASIIPYLIVALVASVIVREWLRPGASRAWLRYTRKIGRLTRTRRR